MSFDEMYDEMLHDEFSSRGKHQAKTAAVEAEPAPVQSTSRGRHAAAEEAGTDSVERPRGFQRYRTAALVGAGGMACAAAGAFLGGLGGYFTISPAAAHAVASPTITQDLPLAQAVSHGSHSSSGARGTSAVMAAEFSKVFGSLTNGIAPFASLTSDPFGNLAVPGLPGHGGKGSGGGAGHGTVGGGGGGGGAGGGGGGGVTGCALRSSGLDLTCILSGLTGVLGNLGSVTSGNPGTTAHRPRPGLGGVVGDVTGTLQNLTSLLPIASLPLPTGGIPTTLLGGTGGGPVTGPPATTGGTPSNPVVSALAPGAQHRGVRDGRPRLDRDLDPLAPAADDDRHDAAEPPLPLGHDHADRPARRASAPRAAARPTVNVPLPVPVPVNTPTITIGGLSVGVNSSGSTSGLTLTLP